eukprot:TRINITY_DN23528_c0_g3_i1.p18 TRINITY_DN23528_c0_g3~~TRINITY_DN23528_c0_g3_i1.p18  ORF type:complete len:122 (-),score=4.13 TRINITY_DN23528_c0_g3_i1:2036-2401(-)
MRYDIRMHSTKISDGRLQPVLSSKKERFQQRETSKLIQDLRTLTYANDMYLRIVSSKQVFHMLTSQQISRAPLGDVIKKPYIKYMHALHNSSDAMQEGGNIKEETYSPLHFPLNNNTTQLR